MIKMQPVLNEQMNIDDFQILVKQTLLRYFETKKELTAKH